MKAKEVVETVESVIETKEWVEESMGENSSGSRWLLRCWWQR